MRRIRAEWIRFWDYVEAFGWRGFRRDRFLYSKTTMGEIDQEIDALIARIKRTRGLSLAVREYLYDAELRIQHLRDIRDS